MLFEDVVKQISQQAGVRVGVGVLVEYPLSRPRQKSLETLLSKGRRGRKYTAPYNVRQASVVLLVEKHRSRATVFTAVQILWKRWWRVWLANATIAGCHFVRQDEQIKVCELQDNGQYFGGHISDFYVLDLNGQILDIFDLMARAKALKKKLINSNLNVKDLKFLAVCDDLEWLARRYPSNVPKPFKQQVKSRQKEKAKDSIDSKKMELDVLKSKWESKKYDLLEVKDRKHPNRRWFWKLINNNIVRELIDVVILILVFLLVIVGFVINYLLGLSILTIFLGSVFLLILISILYYIAKIVFYYRSWSEKINKFLNRFSHIEESRGRKTEEYYSNLNNS